MGKIGDPATEAIKALGSKVIEVPFVPTAENIAVWLHKRIDDLLAESYQGKLVCSRLRLYETPTSFVDVTR